MKMEITMKEMKTIYQVGGKLCKDFIGQISYTVCLDQTYEELDIEFSFGPQHLRPEDVTPELKQRLLDYCKKEYGMERIPGGMGRCCLSRHENRDPHHGNPERYVHRQYPQTADNPAYAFYRNRSHGRLYSAAEYRGCVESNHSGIFRTAGQHRLSADGTRTLRGTFYV